MNCHVGHRQAGAAGENSARQGALEAEARASVEDTRTPLTTHAAALPMRGRPRPRPSDVPEARAQRNFTDPESRIMKTAEGLVQGDNA